MPFALFPLDSNGMPQNAVRVAGTGSVPQWIPVSGALVGAHNLTFTPQGSAIDKVPTFAFHVFAGDARNLAADIGAQISAIDLDSGIEAARGPITAVDRTVDATGALSLNITADDLLQELVRESATTGFATSQGESLNLTLARIVGLSLGPSWTISNVDVIGFDGVSFSCANRSVAQALLDLARARRAHIRRGPGRSVLFGRFGTPSGIRLEQPQPNATGQTEGAGPLIILPGVSFKRDGHVRNSLTPTGAGSGWQALTLRPLYNASGESVVLNTLGNDVGIRQSGAASFAGADASHPIRRRPTGNPALTNDGYDYFVEDDTSISIYGRWSDALPQPQIGPVVNAAGGVSRVDEVGAAVALYAVTVSELKWAAVPKMQVQVSTDVRPGGPWQSLTNLGGNTVHVRYSDLATDISDPSRPAVVALNVDDDYVVQDLVVTEGTKGELTANWTLTNNGQYVRSTTDLVLGALDAGEAQRTAIQTTGTPIYRAKSQNIGPGADLVMQFRADNASARTHYMIGYLTLEGLVHSRADNGHVQDVVTAPTPHDISNAGAVVRHDIGTQGTLPHDVASLPHDVASLPHDVAFGQSQNYHFRIGGLDTGTNGADYDPGTTLSLASGVAPPGAVSLVTDGTYIWAAGHSAGQIDLFSLHLGIIGPSTTTGGTGGTVQPTTGGTGGTVKATSGGTGGTVKATTGARGGHIPATSAATHPGGAGTTRLTTHRVSDGHGATLAVATQESVYRGPTPTGVTVLVDGVQRFGPFNSSPGPLDFTPWMSDQNAHELRVQSPTNGAAEIEIEGLKDRAALAIKPTG